MAFDAPYPDEENEPEYEGFALERYLAFWREYADGYAEPRKQHFRDEEYYDGDVKGTGWGQWTTGELLKLAERGQPPSVRNVIQRKINSLSGVEQRARSEPRALPRNPQDQKSAEVVTDSLRYVKEQTRWSEIKAECFLDALKVGYTACEIMGAEDSVPVEKIDWRDFFFDPRSRRHDFSDARYLGIAKWIDADVALATYAQEPAPPQLPAPPIGDPVLMAQWQAMQMQAEQAYKAELARYEEIKKAIENTTEGAGILGGTADVPDYDELPLTAFGDRKRKRIFVVDMWHQDPQHGWFRCVFTGAGKLFTEPAWYEEPDPRDPKRKIKTHPIKAFSLNVSRERWRYGEVRGMRPVQDEINKRLSKELDLITRNQLFIEFGAKGQKTTDQLRKEIAQPDGVIEVMNLQGVRVENNLQVAAGLSQLRDNASAFLEMSGPNPQLQGEQGRATSGRAVLALQQAGLGALGPLFDRLHDWELRCYRSMWARIQQFWTAPMYVRVTDDKNAARFAAVNGAMPPPNPQAQDEDQQQQPNMLGHNGGPAGDPLASQGGPMLADLDMDVIIDRAPEAATLQAEQFEELAKLAQGGIPIPPEIIIMASSLPNKTELLDALEKAKQQPNPAEEMAKQKAAAEIENKQADTAQKTASAEKTRAEGNKAKTDATMATVDAATRTALLAQGIDQGLSEPTVDEWSLDAPQFTPDGQRILQ